MRLRYSVALATAAAIAAVGVLALAASGQTATKIGVISVRKSQSFSHNVGRERGVLVHRGVRVGDYSIRFKVIRPHRARARAIASFTGRGSLKIKGVFGTGKNNRIPIIGGTGEFNGAAGKLKTHELSGRRTHLTFLFVQ